MKVASVEEQFIFVKMPDLLQQTALSKTSIYRMIRKGMFPRSFKIGQRAVAWKASEIREWMEDRVKSA